MLGAKMSVPAPKLYVLPGSHPCAAVEAALKLKSIDYRRVDLIPITPVLIGPLRYGGCAARGRWRASPATRSCRCRWA